jgi:hypothetical protein
MGLGSTRNRGRAPGSFISRKPGDVRFDRDDAPKSISSPTATWSDRAAAAQADAAGELVGAAAVRQSASRK